MPPKRACHIYHGFDHGTADLSIISILTIRPGRVLASKFWEKGDGALSTGPFFLTNKPLYRRKNKLLRSAIPFVRPGARMPIFF
jgi:hypothetical protein